MPSLPPVSQKVIADVEQYLSEWKRMENQTARSASNIDREVDDLTKKIKRKFSLGDVGRDILRGAGLFGGFEIARTAAELIKDHYRAAAEAAKSIEESTARQLDLVRKTIALKQDDRQQIETLQKEFEQTGRDLAAASAQKYARTFKGGVGLDAFSMVEDRRFPRERTKEETAEVNKLTEAYQELGFKIAEAQKKQRDTTHEIAAKETTSDRDRKIAALTAGAQAQEKAFAQLIETQAKASDKTEKLREEATKLAEKYREMADPTLQFKNQIAEINALMADGKLTWQQGAKAIEEVKRAMQLDEGQRINKALDEFFGDLDQQSKLNQGALKELKHDAQELGYAFQSAFEDAVIGGNKLSDVLRGLVQDLEKIWLRRNITGPLVASLGGGTGFLGGIGSMLGFATGGDFTVGGGGGTDSQVVAFRATPGEQVSVRTPAQQGGEGGTMVFNFSYNFQTGVTRQEVAGLLPRMVEAAKQAVADGVQRGGGYRRAMA